MNSSYVVATALVVAAVLLPSTWLLVVRRMARNIRSDAERDRRAKLDQADEESRARLREAELTAKEELLKARSELDRVASEQRRSLEQRERELVKAQDALGRDRRRVDQQASELDDRERKTAELERRATSDSEEYRRMVDEERRRLESLAGLTAQQAKLELAQSLEEEVRMESAHLAKRLEDEARERSKREAQRIIGMAIERCASDYVNETTVSVVMLPSDDMKGRIIGREGRNIRALEMATGVDLIVDDTPEAVILSGYDPYRREIARVVLERLISDGRIHPARIEEVTEKVKAELEQRIQQEGDAALLEVNLTGVHPELTRLLGRLRFRTSYGQNVLQHSKEVAFLAATMAGELGVDVHVAKRAGLMHDIGKAIDRDMEGTHLELGIELLRKYGESEAVVHAMACHHGDYDPETVEAVLVTAADALSAARPGARREVLETYLKRLEKLEEIAGDFEGVQKTYAIQAGREIRVVVDCKTLSDEQSLWLSKDIAKKIESELTYPGQIKVTVIRESRSIEYAR